MLCFICDTKIELFKMFFFLLHWEICPSPACFARVLINGSDRHLRLWAYICELKWSSRGDEVGRHYVRAKYSSEQRRLNLNDKTPHWPSLILLAMTNVFVCRPQEKNSNACLCFDKSDNTKWNWQIGPGTQLGSQALTVDATSSKWENSEGTSWDVMEEQRESVLGGSVCQIRAGWGYGHSTLGSLCDSFLIGLTENPSRTVCLPASVILSDC